MARRTIQRGLDDKHEQDPLLLLRDTRTLGERIAGFFASSFNTGLVLCVMGASAFILPGLVDLIFIAGISLFFYNRSQRTTLPFRMPKVSKALDYGDLKPGIKKPYMARGITFFGNEMRTNEELWFANEDMRTHVLIFGSTGSGKTEALLSIAYNSLIQASGFIYVDGKGDSSLYAKVFAMARFMGRDDDMLVVNFMTGARDVFGAQEKRLSNTLNPFANGSSSMLTNLIVSLMDSSGGGTDGDMWKGRAISFVEALMKTLAYMRDAGHILLDANSIRNYFTLDKLESIVVDKVFPREGQEPVSLEGVPPVVLEPIGHYVNNLPGYDKSKKGKQVSQVLEQHGFITMQLTRVFTSLADTYGHILRVRLAEVDLKDVVLNRRILCVLLPALEKSPEELSNLGKVIVASLKAMMATGLGSEVEGSYRELISRKPTNAITPYVCILDEYGYYAVDGFAVVPAQARSLGFSAIFAGQDLPAFQKASKEEAASIGANTNIKLCMKLEDPSETWEFFQKTAGEAYVTKVDTFQTDANSVMNNYLDTRSSSAEKRQRIDLLDLKEQTEGEAHIFFKSKIIRTKMFYAAPPAVPSMRLNHYLRVEAPPTKALINLEKRAKQFKKVAADPQAAFGDYQVENDEDIALIAQNMANISIENGINRGVAAVKAFQGGQQEQEAEEEEETDELPFDEMNIFTPFRMVDPLVPQMVGHNFEAFSQPILAKRDTVTKIELVERLTGKSMRHAKSIANEIIKDIDMATHYPPEMLSREDPDYAAQVVAQLITEIARKVQESSDDKTDGSDDF